VQDILKEDCIKMEPLEMWWETVLFICFRIGISDGSCEHGNEPSVSVKGWEFLDLLSEYKLLKKDSGPWS
jgi:hypothetical protein